MVKALTVTQIEHAINYWRAVKPSVDEITLCAEVSALANLYGAMIAGRAQSVEVSTLTVDQSAAMRAALEAFGTSN